MVEKWQELNEERDGEWQSANVPSQTQTRDITVHGGCLNTDATIDIQWKYMTGPIPDFHSRPILTLYRHSEKRQRNLWLLWVSSKHQHTFRMGSKFRYLFKTSTECQWAFIIGSLCSDQLQPYMIKPSPLIHLNGTIAVKQRGCEHRRLHYKYTGSFIRKI